jgi:hypothetical protein
LQVPPSGQSLDVWHTTPVDWLAGKSIGVPLSQLFVQKARDWPSAQQTNPAGQSSGPSQAMTYEQPAPGAGWQAFPQQTFAGVAHDVLPQATDDTGVMNVVEQLPPAGPGAELQVGRSSGSGMHR